MAKVMVSLPDDMLAALDREAAEKGMTRSGLLREYVEQARKGRARARAARIREIMSGHEGDYGGNSVELLKAGRPKP